MILYWHLSHSLLYYCSNCVYTTECVRESIRESDNSSPIYTHTPLYKLALDDFLQKADSVDIIFLFVFGRDRVWGCAPLFVIECGMREKERAM